ncbi:MAG TPA: acyl-CoA dehydrogenase family protein, partial [Alphaproteobacteria bacterium]|nr:acyl-CoA dehydrogenase family protein [Alphaproteobacteria bacterium]
MPTYTPPIADMKLLLEKVTPLTDLGRDDLDSGMVEAILEEAGKLAAGSIAPLNEAGDREGARLENGDVKTAKGFKDAYKLYTEGGWNAVPFDVEFGGQGLPWLMSFPVQEMWQSASLSFGLCPLLNQGAVEAITHHGTSEQKEFYLPHLIAGNWTGTMNLTEPGAGSDLALIKSKAERNGDGTYRIFGQKIFITYGDHDMADNIIHLVLARLPDAPEGVKGISLFIVPKFLADGTRNDVKCVGLEHKLGIHASPTCTMQFGDAGGAVGYLIGEEHQGLKYMFTMMNNARLSVGLQGVALCERATQAAKAYAADRKQGKPLTGGDTATIDKHPDVKRMILSMESLTLAGRALAYEAAFYLDKAATGDKGAQERVDLLTPIVKSWCTDNAVEVASLGVQVHGGMGFIEETGAAQFYRDARILSIYEGTNGIQSSDLVFRKLLRDDGAAMTRWSLEMKQTKDTDILASLSKLDSATAHLLDSKANPDGVAAVSVPYLNL